MSTVWDVIKKHLPHIAERVEAAAKPDLRQMLRDQGMPDRVIDHLGGPERALRIAEATERAADLMRSGANGNIGMCVDRAIRESELVLTDAERQSLTLAAVRGNLAMDTN